jgi:hypothetical protein
VTMGNKDVEQATQIGDIPGVLCDKHGNELSKTMVKDVALIPKCGYNLFSITKLLKDNWNLSGTKEQLVLQKGKHKVVFDICIPTPKGVIFAMYLKRNAEIAGASTDDKAAMMKITIQQAHDKLGHCGVDATRSAAKQLEWEITGTMKPCEACAAGKAKQKNLPKHDKDDMKNGGKTRIYLDIATVRPEKDQPKPTKSVWRIMVDERTQLKFSDFYKRKSDMVEPTCEQFKKWAHANKALQVVRMDNAGENKLLQKRSESKDWQLGITFEYTARDTPQQNSLAEVGFATLTNRGRAMMHKANIPMEVRPKVWTEAFKTATLLDGLIPIEIDGKIATRYVHWCGKNPDFAKHLRTWGEAGTVKTKTAKTPKLMDSGVQCMFVGYALDHSGDCYRMWDPVTKRVHETRDVIWLKRLFYTKPATEADIATGPMEIDIDNEVEKAPSSTAGEGNENAEAAEAEEIGVPDSDNQATVVTTKTGRTVKAPQRLIEEIGAVAGNYEIQLTEAEMNYYTAMKSFLMESLNREKSLVSELALAVGLQTLRSYMC